MTMNLMKPNEWETPNFGKDGPVLFLPIKEKYISPTGQVLDDSGNLNNGTNNGATWVDGPYGPALSFDGSGDYVGFGKIPSLVGGGDVTIITKIKLASLGNSVAVATCTAGLADSEANNSQWQLSINTSNQIVSFWEYGSGNNVAVTATSTSLSAGIWYTVAIVKSADGTAVDIYIDGVAVGGATGLTKATGGGNATVQVGRLWPQDDREAFGGDIEYVYMVDQSQSATEIKDLTDFPWRPYRRDNTALWAASQGGAVFKPWWARNANNLIGVA